MEESKLRKNIMFRVYLIWLLRKVAPVVVCEILFLLVAMHLFSGSVFIAKVMENAAIMLKGGPSNILAYSWSSFWNSRATIKLEMLAMVLIGWLLLWRIKRAIVSYEMIRRPRVLVPAPETKPNLD